MKNLIIAVVFGLASAAPAADIAALVKEDLK